MQGENSGFCRTGEVAAAGVWGGLRQAAYAAIEGQERGVVENTAGANPQGLTRGVRSEGGGFPPLYILTGGRGTADKEFGARGFGGFGF
jgi:hypothetical protein